jgi:general L-amino acid transport system permease protein
MAVIEKGGSSSGSGGKSALAFINDERFRSVFYQMFVGVVVLLAGYYLYTNTAANLDARGMEVGFGFLGSTAGFSVAWSLIPYEAGDTYFHVFLVGIGNTLLVAAIAIVASTFLGFVMGVLRLSKNWLIRNLAAWYVEILRNTPLLLQILFWFLTVFALLPSPRQSLEPVTGFVLNNRGFYFPSPQPGDLFFLTAIAFVIGIVGAVILSKWATKRLFDTGQKTPVFPISLGLIFGFPLVVFLVTGAPLAFDLPTLQGFNFVGGASVPPSFCALLLALTIYHSCFMAEAVRAGILSVSHGQTEAAYSLGLKPSWTLRLVIIPQAMRAVVPPMISNWMNVVKNSSLAIAIGFPDLVAVFMQTSLNQSGHAIEIVAMVMLFYMTVSLSISLALNQYNKSVQLKER